MCNAPIAPESVRSEVSALTGRSPLNFSKIGLVLRKGQHMPNYACQTQRSEEDPLNYILQARDSFLNIANTRTSLAGEVLNVVLVGKGQSISMSQALLITVSRRDPHLSRERTRATGTASSSMKGTF